MAGLWKASVRSESPDDAEHTSNELVSLFRDAVHRTAYTRRAYWRKQRRQCDEWFGAYKEVDFCELMLYAIELGYGGFSICVPKLLRSSPTFVRQQFETILQRANLPINVSFQTDWPNPKGRMWFSINDAVVDGAEPILCPPLFGPDIAKRGAEIKRESDRLTELNREYRRHGLPTLPVPEVSKYATKYAPVVDDIRLPALVAAVHQTVVLGCAGFSLSAPLTRVVANYVISLPESSLPLTRAADRKLEDRAKFFLAHIALV